MTHVITQNGKDFSFIDAVCICQAPINFFKTADSLKNNGLGIYNLAFGRSMKNVFLQNEAELRDYYKNEHNIDLK